MKATCFQASRPKISLKTVICRCTIYFKPLMVHHVGFPLSQECENIGDPESKKHVSMPESYCFSKDDLRLDKPYGLPRPYYDHVISLDTLKDESELIDSSLI